MLLHFLVGNQPPQKKLKHVKINEKISRLKICLAAKAKENYMDTVSYNIHLG